MAKSPASSSSTYAKRQHMGTPIPLPEVPPNVDVIRDVAFGPHKRQSYDVYLPREAKLPLPVMVFFHPGAWIRRDKRAVRTMFILEHGFALISVGYRLAQHACFPAQIRDVNEGLRHILDHAVDYGIDPTRLVLAGTSAGAHLAALAALANGNSDFTPVSDLKPRGVVALYGAYNAQGLIESQGELEIDPTDAESPLGMLLGKPPDRVPDQLRAVSPINYIQSGAPSFLIMHGSEDRVLPWSQSEEFAEALMAAGNKVTLKIVPGVGHGSEVFRSPPISDEIVAFVNNVTATIQT